MFDQSFSADNFRKIFDYENRKGVYLASSFFPDAHEKSREIKQCNDELRALRKLGDPLKKRERLAEIKLKLEQEKEQILVKAFDEVSAITTQRNFSVSLQEKKLKGKSIYVTANSTADYSGLTKEQRLELAAEYFALKQTQRNIRKLYKVKQADRYNIVCQFREAIRGRFPKWVIRTDISSFYESIPRDGLIKKINDDNLLTYNSKKVIKQILYEYRTLSGQSQKGIPRGVGVSAYLSELYMRKFDKKILKSSNVLYYARYVDDIIVIYTADPNFDSLGKRIRDEGFDFDSFSQLIRDEGLEINAGKTSLTKVCGDTEHTIEYLGYSFKFGAGDVKIELTEDKVERYKKKIDLSFADYKKHSKRNEKKARRLLVNRIKFLTGNTRLIGNKKNIRVGMYFSNKVLNDFSCLDDLDTYLQSKITNDTPKILEQIKLQNRQALKKKIQRVEKNLKLSFKNGFKNKVFYKFSKTDLENIMEAWKDV